MENLDNGELSQTINPQTPAITGVPADCFDAIK
jgi:hypothetical protein